MRILIDADGCPVVDLTVKIACEQGLACLIFCDTSHYFRKEGAETVAVDQGNDSVDLALVNSIEPGDIVITQDYGLAAMALARRGQVLSQDGLIYDEHNIESLLLSRYTAKKIRRGGGRLKGPRKRTVEQDQKFYRSLLSLLKGKKQY
ncbi:MAG: YaiI/YqxD family protein [Bacillota bacterium]